MMTSLEWFAFVILPATLAVVALGVSRLFDYLHPAPADTPAQSASQMGGAVASENWTGRTAANERVAGTIEAMQRLNLAIEAVLQNMERARAREESIPEQPQR
ncbi:MAG: hypothetical protein WCE79_09310 [Xanthobacteraceae bacterium]